MSEEKKKWTPPSISQLDQSRSLMVDYFPLLWWGLYNNCLQVGFTEQQAFACLLTYITASSKPA